MSGTGCNGEDTEWEFWLRDCFLEKRSSGRPIRFEDMIKMAHRQIGLPCNDLHSDELSTLLQER